MAIFYQPCPNLQPFERAMFNHFFFQVSVMNSNTFCKMLLKVTKGKLSNEIPHCFLLSLFWPLFLFGKFCKAVACAEKKQTRYPSQRKQSKSG